MRRTVAVAAAFLVSVLAPAVARAETTTWKLDPMHSHASFTIRHLAISNVRGEFHKMSGNVTYDEQDPTKSFVAATIDAASIDTREARRDADLKSANFFDVEKYPTITFKSTKVDKAGDGKLKVTGDLTMHGTTKPVVLDVEGPTSAIKDAQGAQRRGFLATTAINRKDFGLTWNKVVEAAPVAGDEVKIEISAEMVQQPGDPAAQAKAEHQAAKPAEKGTRSAKPATASGKEATK